MPAVTVVPADRLVIVDGEALLFDFPAPEGPSMAMLLCFVTFICLLSPAPALPHSPLPPGR